jgi:hypothetical protein
MVMMKEFDWISFCVLKVFLKNIKKNYYYLFKLILFLVFSILKIIFLNKKLLF